MKKILLLLSLTLFSFLLISCSDDPEYQETADDYKDVDTCYQIFPISYADGNGDGRGDLEGIMEKADYLSETLDVDCVWLTPVNESPSYHKYDVVDYYSIDEQFGDEETYEAFLETMDEHGIKVLMDFVINHTSYQHPWFEEARSDEDSEYRDYYVWSSEEELSEDYHSQEGWVSHGDEYYFASFWDQMPELNYENEDVREEIKDIATYWLDKGVDGFRIDAARHIYDRNEFPKSMDTEDKNVEWFLEFNDHVKEENPDALILGEVWVEDHDFVGKYLEGMDSTFNFRTAVDIIDMINSGRDNETIDNLIEGREVHGETREDFIDSVFLTNHDQNRIMSEFSENENKSKLAANILFTLPGISWVYYGEELGMSGEKPDESIRQPFKWAEDDPLNTEAQNDGINAWNAYNEDLGGVDGQLDDPDSMLSHYQTLIALKKDHDVLRNGSIHPVDTNSAQTLAYERRTDDASVVVIHNLTKTEKTVSLDMSLGDTLYDHQGEASVENGEIELEGRSSIIIETD